MGADVKPIRSRRDYEAAIKAVERLWGAKAGTCDGDRLDVLATLIDSYEAEHYPMDPPDPVEAIKWHLISKAGGNSDPYLDKYAADQPDEVREAAQKAARPWLAALPPKS